MSGSASYVAVIVVSSVNFFLSSELQPVCLNPVSAVTFGASVLRSTTFVGFTCWLVSPDRLPCSPLAKVTVTYPAGFSWLPGITSGSALYVAVTVVSFSNFAFSSLSQPMCLKPMSALTFGASVLRSTTFVGFTCWLISPDRLPCSPLAKVTVT